MAAPTVKVPRTIPQELQQEIVKLAVLRGQIFRYAAAYKRLSKEISAKLAQSVEVRP
jgi:hypothetical protein